MRSDFFLVLASAALAMATPLPRAAGCSSPNAKPVLPVNGGAKELPTPPADVQLKHIALGFGIQNYTCTGEGATSVAVGALAMLYDITDLYPGSRANSLSQEAWDKLTTTALNGHAVPLNLDASTDGRIPAARPGASATEPFPASSPLELSGMAPLPFAGHHHFDGAAVPTFGLEDGGLLIRGKKLDSVDAPSAAGKSPDGSAAVPWLQLGDAGNSVGLKFVYRVLTAGGNPHTCTGAGQDSSDYAAQYWFYG